MVVSSFNGGVDVFVSGPRDWGKTFAAIVGLTNYLTTNASSRKTVERDGKSLIVSPRAIFLTTRLSQLAEEFRKVTHATGTAVRSFGEGSKATEPTEFAAGVDVILNSPLCVANQSTAGKLKLSSVEIVVVDNIDDSEKILRSIIDQATSPSRQLVVLSSVANRSALQRLPVRKDACLSLCSPAPPPSSAPRPASPQAATTSPAVREKESTSRVERSESKDFRQESSRKPSSPPRRFDAPRGSSGSGSWRSNEAPNPRRHSDGGSGWQQDRRGGGRGARKPRESVHWAKEEKKTDLLFEDLKDRPKGWTIVFVHSEKRLRGLYNEEVPLEGLEECSVLVDSSQHPDEAIGKVSGLPDPIIFTTDYFAGFFRILPKCSFVVHYDMATSVQAYERRIEYLDNDGKSLALFNDADEDMVQPLYWHLRDNDQRVPDWLEDDFQDRRRKGFGGRGGDDSRMGRGDARGKPPPRSMSMPASRQPGGGSKISAVPTFEEAQRQGQADGFMHNRDKKFEADPKMLCWELDRKAEHPIDEPSFYDIATLEDSNVHGHDLQTVVLAQGTPIFKGMNKLAWPEDEEEYWATHGTRPKPSWFGSKYIAYTYSKLEGGAVHAYQAARPMRLFLFTHVENIRRAIQIIKDFADTKAASPRERDTLHEAARVLRLKTGVDCTIEEQSDLKQQLKKYNDKTVWTYDKIEPKPGYYTVERTIALENFNPWGLMKIDTLVANALCTVFNDHFDGYVTRQSKSTIAVAGCLGEEMVLFTPKNCLRRDLRSPYDWTNYVHPKSFSSGSIPFKFNETLYHSKNKNNQVIKFYFENQFKRPKGPAPVHSATEPSLRVCALNTHGFCSINLEDTYQDAFLGICELAKSARAEVMCCLEYKVTDKTHSAAEMRDSMRRIAALEYASLPPTQSRVSRDSTEINIAVFSAHEILSETKIKLARGSRALVFEIQKSPQQPHIRIAALHMELGQRLHDRLGFLLPDPEGETRKSNSELRLADLRELVIGHSPDIILGDFNFVPTDPEFSTLQAMGYSAELVGHTTPFLTQVDFVFVRTGAPAERNLAGGAAEASSESKQEGDGDSEMGTASGKGKRKAEEISDEDEPKAKRAKGAEVEKKPSTLLRIAECKAVPFHYSDHLPVFAQVDFGVTHPEPPAPLSEAEQPTRATTTVEEETEEKPMIADEEEALE